ncbi:MAG: SDR family oxidoreductase [Gammaproteobacteria bacterium]|nr:SDR family oxidoreductase [Gammaproteobacteria bacterium]
MKKILIIGATSAIAEATAQLWAAEGNSFYLIARNKERLSSIEADLMVRGAKSVQTMTLDLNNFKQHDAVIKEAFMVMEGIDIALIAHGTLSKQKECEKDFDKTLFEINTNAISTISLLTHLANHFESQKYGTIAVISSVAADRGRASNYVYGAAKAAINTYCSGLRARLFRDNIHVLVIKPGFVSTPMTANLNLPRLLTVSARYVARDIKHAIRKQKNEIYTPWYWAWIMLIIRCLHTDIFKKIRL